MLQVGPPVAALADSAAHWLYVYYRVAAVDVPAAVAAVQRLQADLQTAHPGLQAALLRRPALQAGQATLMETYHHPGGLLDSLQATISHAAQQALAPWLQGERHNELFVRLA